MKSCTIIACSNCEFYNTQYCKNCSKEGVDCYEHWEWRHDISWRQEQIDNLTQKIADLEYQLALTEKALELACKWINDIQEMDSDCPIYADCFRVEKDFDNWDCGNCDCSKFAIEHFKTKAKEMLK